jgi:uncharacterized membrane protein YciS (DUF1049 family)
VRSLRIFAIGAAAVIIALLVPAYEPAVEALAAITFVLMVALGFLLHPRRGVFYVRTTVHLSDLDRNLVVEHDQLAVKVEPVRLWLLFLPTFLVIAFLVLTAANGTLWKFSLVDWLLSFHYLAVVALLRLPGLIVALIGGALWIWLTERRVFRDADACSARSVKVEQGQISFTFMDRSGGYGGGEGTYFGLVRSPALARLVFYNRHKTEVNKIGMGLLFHRPIILGRGLTDLDYETAAAHQISTEPAH